MQYDAYREILAILRRQLPPAYPVSVRRLKMSGLDGDCSLYKKKFYIRINRDLDESAAIDTLLHEWGHARAWNHLHDAVDDEEFQQRSHDASWGVAYSEVYRTYETFYLYAKD